MSSAQYIYDIVDDIDYHIEKSIVPHNWQPFDLALVLCRHFNKDYACISIMKSVWCKRVNHEWCVIDNKTVGIDFSKWLYDIYVSRHVETVKLLVSSEKTNPTHSSLEERANALKYITENVQKEAWIKNIMREAKELFYNINGEKLLH